MDSKPFDAVEMKRQGAEHVRRLIQGMTREQLLRFWAERHAELEAQIRQACEQAQQQQHKRPA